MLRSAIAAAVLVCCAAPLALADGVHLNGVAPRSIGRGGTNLGFADNGGIIFDNPAAMVNINSEGLFEVGIGMLVTDMTYADPDNGSNRNVMVNGLPEFAMIRRTDDGDWAFGLGVFTPAGFSESHVLQGQAPFPGDQLYKSFAMLTKVLPSVAYKVNDQLSIGGSFGVAINHVELEGPYTLQNAGPLTGLPTIMDLQATGATPIFSLGLQYQLFESTTLGVTYQSESRFKLDGNTRADIPLIGQRPFDTDVDITWPRTLGIGVRHQLDPCQVLSADVIWFDWSSAFDTFGVTLTEETLPGSPQIREQVPLNWSDTVAVRLGYERKLDECQTVRCGYLQTQNPVPNETLTPYIQAITQYGVSLGYGTKYGLWDVDVGYMFCFSRKVRVDQSGFLGGDFDNSEHKAYGHYLGASLIRRF
jgi:long-chain fatty acid transport protein